MREFGELIAAIDGSNKTTAKVYALVNFFNTAPDADKVWAVALLTGRRLRRAVTHTQIRTWGAEWAGIPLWLFEESYHVVGDLSETISLFAKDDKIISDKSLADFMSVLRVLPDKSDDEKRLLIFSIWDSLPPLEIFIFNKLISGNFRIGVSTSLVVRSLAQVTNQTPPEVQHRLMGNWEPEYFSFDQLVQPTGNELLPSTPYPFFLAYQLEQPIEELGEPEQWQAEWKWDGIRGQIVKRGGEVYIWSRGEDLISEQFPELIAMAGNLPDGTVIDGEILPFLDEQVMPFALLQTRLGRKNPGRAILSKAPVAFFSYDLLEEAGVDLRSLPLSERRARLEQLISTTTHPALRPAPVISFSNWNELSQTREKARDVRSEGLILKRVDSTYGSGRKKGSWWKWKVDPLSVDAVLIYAQKGSGRRAGLYTDYTFAVWDEEGKLVPFAKAYSGLTDKEIGSVNSFVNRNTIEKFGPVRSVKPELVFEIGFEGINKSSRHKSGLAVRFPRILRWRKDKKADEADTLENLRKIMEAL